MDVVRVESDIGLKQTLLLTLDIVVQCLLYPLSFVLTLNCASIEEGRDGNRCLATIFLLVGTGTVLFGLS